MKKIIACPRHIPILSPLLCPVLLLPMPDATILSPCGHTLSWRAVQMLREKKCPIDRQTYTGTIPNFSVRQFWDLNKDIDDTDPPVFIPPNIDTKTNETLSRLSSEGEAAYKNEDWEGARQKYEQILNSIPDHPHINYNLFCVRIMQGHFDFTAINKAIAFQTDRREEYLTTRQRYLIAHGYGEIAS